MALQEATTTGMVVDARERTLLLVAITCNHPSGSCPWNCAANGGGCMWTGSNQARDVADR